MMNKLKLIAQNPELTTAGIAVAKVIMKITERKGKGKVAKG